jgi:mono/diheme cytochrome c family protein
MHKYSIQSALIALLVVGLLSLTGARLALGQFTQNRETIHIDPSGFPAEIHQGYKIFRVKCRECHTLDTSLKPSFSFAQWTAIVKQMQAMASSHFNDRQAQSILDFLNYDESHRKAALKLQPSSTASGSIAGGQQVYVAQSCDTCHSIAGKGGNMGPALDGVGGKLSRDQITQVVKDGKANTAMPALQPGTTEQQLRDLVDFLASLK